MFVKKLVEKASKKPGGNLNGLKINDVNPRLVFHYGIPPGSISLAYDSIQKILAISTKDGRIKLLGKDNTQALLESNEMVPSKFLQFVENQGILLNVTVQNHLEVWDIDKKQLSHVHAFKEEITSFTLMQQLYMYVGDSLGNVSVLKLDQEPCQIVKMKYNIPLPASHGNTTEVAEDTAVMHILSQPTAESKRVLIIFRDGLIILWAIRESKVIFVTGGNKLHSLCHETKKVTSACWACPFGSKVVVGYSNGEIFFWSIPPISNSKSESETDKEELFAAQNVPICKLNLGYKMDKIPIISLKWAYADGKASRLYVMGACDSVSSNLLQVIILNEQTESRTVKLLLPLSEPCLDMEFISSTSDQSKHKQDSLLLLLKSGHLYVYDDSMIEKYLLQCQSRSPPSLPKEVMIKMPFADSSITVAKFITDDPNRLSIMDEEYILLAKNMPPLLPVEMKGKDGNHLNATHFSGFSKIKNLYITGHSNGAINFWDVSCPFLLPIFSVKQQSDDDLSLSGIPVNALHFDSTCRVLVTGDQSGMVRIFKLKPEPFTTENSFLSLQGSTKRGSSHIIHSIKLIKVNGSVLSININRSSGHLAVGSDQGYVVLIDMEGPTVLFQKHMTSELCNSIISLQFETCSFHGFEKNILLVVTKDSSVLALESDTGNTLSTSMVRPKKPSRALFMQILDGQVTSIKGSNISDGLNSSKGNSSEDVIPKQPLLLLCSEKAVYLYSLMHVVRGVKKVNYKKKFHATCCWVSTFYTPSSDVGLILLFTSGKIEIRSLPELSLLKETLIRGFTFSTSKLYSDSETSICSSCNGELILANGDQEVFVVSVLSRKENYRLLDPISKVYKKDLIALQEGALFGPIIHKEKKKGIFSYVIKDMGNKAKHGPDREAEDPRASIEELSAIFSTANFLFDTENRDDLVVDEDEVELNIDDIDLEDTGEKPKGQNMIAALNKQKLTSKFQAIKGKLKQIKVKNEKTSAKEEHEDEKAGTVDQIKKRYGFPLSGDSSVAKIAENKLTENLRKLQGINTRTTEMQDTARSFSFMAKEVLRTAEQDKRSL